MTTLNWQKLEGLLIFGLCIWAAIASEGMTLWALVLMLFAPDLSMVGYAVGPRFGAALYNIAHIYGFGIAVLAAAYILGSPFWISAGLLFIAHAGLDRIFGFGLKEQTGFKDTHMGRLK